MVLWGYMKLSDKKCIPCEGGATAMVHDDIMIYMNDVPGWVLEDDQKITRTWMFSDFVHAMKFINMVADIAEKDGHHPDIFVSYNRVVIDLWTHSIRGLSENDFIVAAKINAIEKEGGYMN